MNVWEKSVLCKALKWNILGMVVKEQGGQLSRIIVYGGECLPVK